MKQENSNQILETITRKAGEDGAKYLVEYYKARIAAATRQTKVRVSYWLQNRSQPTYTEKLTISQLMDEPYRKLFPYDKEENPA